ncbi:MAG: MobA/MobL family protein [Clostridiales bacterium]|nr:MobA/MobL family protein [Clostridiales bacterium]
MAIYHFSMKIIGRGGKSRHGPSAVAAAAYRSGTKIKNEWSGITADYSRKKGVVYSEIMLPANAPASFYDRAILWNSVEMCEKRRDSQLARDIEVSLPKELPLSEHKKIMQDYCSQFVDAGMCVDFNIHDKGDGNPHCHIMLTIRALDENGKWIPKSREEFILDENGERVRGPNGRWKSRKVNTVDWNSRENAEKWRASWADTVNRYLEKNGFEERIDHRSNADRGLEEIPSIHMGPAACAMEKKGIRTERGDINRKIREANRVLMEIRKKINGLKEWISVLHEVMKEITEKDNSPALSDLMLQYLEIERQRVEKYSGMFQLKHYAEMATEVMETLDRLNDEGICTLADLEAALSDVKGKTDSVRQNLLTKEKRMKELQKLIERGEQYQENDLFHRAFTGIKWKKQKEAYELGHSAELTLWNTANRFLHAKGISPADLPEQIAKWQEELNTLSEAHDLEYSDLKQYREKVKELDKIHRQVTKALAPEPEQSARKKQNMEL